MEGIWTGFPYNKFSVEFYSWNFTVPKKNKYTGYIGTCITWVLFRPLSVWDHHICYSLWIPFKDLWFASADLYNANFHIFIISYHIISYANANTSALLCIVLFIFCFLLFNPTMAFANVWPQQWHVYTWRESSYNYLGVFILGSSCRDLPRCILDLLLVSMECHSLT